MADGNDDPTFRVGYRKPPRHGQFARGKSGNPKGRPRGSTNFATVIDRELRRRVTVNEEGRRKKITKREAVAKQLVNGAAKGDPKATSVLLNETRSQEHGAGGVAVPSLTQEDDLVIANIIRRIREREDRP
jgi:Family of unknown function (DUF5681)